ATSTSPRSPRRRGLSSFPANRCRIPCGACRSSHPSPSDQELIDMQIGNPAAAPNYYDQAGNLRTGNRISRTLLTGTENAPDNYRLGYSYGGDDAKWTTPRHHHNFEQIRYVLEGEYSVATRRTIPAGHIGYFPESAYYGPQDINPELTMLILQFGGPSG